MRLITSVTAATLIVVLLSGCAAMSADLDAQRWKEADVDGNGVMTLGEFETSRLGETMDFDAVDQNEDLLVSHEEYRRYNRLIDARERTRQDRVMR